MCVGATLPCSIEKVQARGFRNFSFEEKKQIIEEGKPEPKLPNLYVEVKGKKKFVRHFQLHYYKTYKWMTGCSKTNKLYCWPCLMFCNETNSWNTRGYDDLNNMCKSIKAHEKSCSHINAVLALSSFNKNTTLLAGFNQQERLATMRHNEKVRSNRAIMKRLIDAVLHLANQESAFRGHDESETSDNKGNYIQTLQLIAKYDKELEEHLSSSSAFKGTSCHIQNDIIHAIASVLINAQNLEIREATFVSILLDESTDRAKHSQLSTVLRYCNKGTVKEIFRGFTNVSSDRTASALFDHVKSTVQNLDCGSKLVGQGYDGAAVMASELNGLQAKVKSEFEHALFIHCCAHVLNLVLSEICAKKGGISECKIFFESLQGFAAFFSVSTKRNYLLENIMHKKFPQISIVRWCFKSKLVNTVNNNRDALIYLFEQICDPTCEIANDFTGSDICMARGFLTYLNEFKFNFLLQVFSVIFNHTDNLYSLLQKKGIEINICLTRLDETVDFLQKNRDEGFENLYFNLLNSLGPPDTRQVRMPDPETHYKALYNEIHDLILAQMRVRFENLRSLKFTALLDHRKFASYESIRGKFPTQAAESLRESYGKFFDYEKLKNELCVLYSSPSFQGKSIAEIYDYLSGDLKTTFSEVYKLCDLILTLPSTTVSVERSFSALNRIMDHLRTTMGQDRLSDLSLLAIERSMLRELTAREDFYDLVIAEFVKKDRRIELHFRQ